MSYGTQPNTHARVIEAALASGAAARSSIAASWSRSACLHGLAPDRAAQPDRMSAAEFVQVRQQMEPMIRAAMPSIERLFRALGGTACAVMLADHAGIPVERRGAAVDDATFQSWGLWTGVLWDEAHQGTNGIGTALAEQRPVTIHGGEHFLSCNTALSCVSAPIYDPEGRICGVIDVSSCRPDLTEGFLRLISHAVAEAAQRIEVDAFREAYIQERIVLLSDLERPAGAHVAAVAVDADDLVVGATRGARQILGLNGDLRKAPRPAADLLCSGYRETLLGAEHAALLRALARAGGNVSAAARDLGISRATFHRKIAAAQRKA